MALPPELPPSPADCVTVDPSSFTFSSDLSNGAPIPPSHPTPQQTADHAHIQHAARLLQSDQVVAFPTETVYGLAANALCANAVAKIYHAKGRPSDNPLIVHISSLAMLKSILPPETPDVPAIYAAVVAKAWPGALTILVPRGPQVPLAVTGGHSTVAVRFPSHPIARALIDACGFPLAAPSANTSGRPSPTLAAHVMLDLGARIPLVIDGGPCGGGVESTVLDGLASPPVVLRPGGVTVEMLKTIPGMENLRVYKKDFVDSGMEAAPTTPGMKYRHYTPEAEVVVFELAQDTIEPHTTHCNPTQLRCAVNQEAIRLLNSTDHKIGILRTTPDPGPSDTDTPLSQNPRIEQIYLGASPDSVAKELFRALREMEHRKVGVILVEGVTEEREGLAVMNRIRKAASRIHIVS
ncbi:hypothetical protein PhCBS80983_g01945 [Powellomyces hirtus]|uniref:Threonylcarbamoyl-AMP synthase n=1 Tax=Powellomyces hirtus TaxID=109895 RepID=A0A507EAM1_9FUNG|nr:hypothetical protein PhCBS80983_g01945 [Powellomyces hirtus]